MKHVVHFLILLAVFCAGCLDVADETELDAARFAPRDGETVLVFTGDIMPWDTMAEITEDQGMDYPYRATRPIIAAADLSIGNLEGPVAERAKIREGMRFGYKMPPKVLPALKDAGFDLVSMANNHIWDCAEAGAIETMNNLDAVGLPYVGAGRDRNAAVRPVVIERKEIRIGVVAFVSPETWFPDAEEMEKPGAFESRVVKMQKRMGATGKRAGTVVASEEAVTSGVWAARAQSDFVVVVMHWGVRYHRPVFDFQERIAHAAIDAGADMVVGHHAHFWQPVEIYRDRPIVYGLGNFAFGSNNPTASEGLIARAVLVDRRVRRVELIPISTRNADPRIHYQSKVMVGRSADRLISELADWSKTRNTAIENDRGVGMMTIP